MAEHEDMIGSWPVLDDTTSIACGHQLSWLDSEGNCRALVLGQDGLGSLCMWKD